MYNIHSHYQKLFSFLQSIITQPRLEYLYPFGSSLPENIEVIDTANSLDVDPIVLCYDQEPLLIGYNDKLFDAVSKSAAALKRPVILITTEKDSAALDYFVKKYKFIPAYCFYHIFAAHDWFRGYDYDPKLIPIKQRVINKKFITFNRLTSNARIYRSLFVSELASKDLVQHGHVSYSDVCPDNNLNYADNLHSAAQAYGVDAEYTETAIDNLNTLAHPLRIDHQDKTQIPNHSMVLSAVDECMETFLHVVTETCFWDHKCHLTEKIFKPIILRQPFVLLGCAYNLEYLKSYGFKTFDRWWPESYDCIQDPVERIKAVTKVVEYVCEKSNDELAQMLLEMEEVLDHNYRLFNSKQFLDTAWDELLHNLTTAIKSAPVLQTWPAVRGTRTSLLSAPL